MAPRFKDSIDLNRLTRTMLCKVKLDEVGTPVEIRLIEEGFNFGGVSREDFSNFFWLADSRG